MTIEKVIVTDVPKTILDNKIVFYFVKIILLVIIFPLILIIAFPFEIANKIFVFIRKKILRLPEKTNELKEDILFQSNHFKLVKKQIFIDKGLNKLAEDFMWSVVHYDDEMDIYQVESDKVNIELHKNLLTDFILETDNDLYFQRIIEKDNKPHSELISLDKNTGVVKVYIDVGLFSLYKFDKKTNEIIGINNNKGNQIKIKVKDIKQVKS